MPKKKLTHQWIEAQDPPEKPVTYYDITKTGLQLRLSKAGTKTFTYRYHINGKQRRLKIGTFPEKSLKQARKDVTEIKAQVTKGIDPQALRQQRKQNQPPTFKELAESFKKKHLPKLKASTQKTYTERIDGEMIPAFKGMAVKDISRGVIIELLEEILERGSPYQSNRVRAILSSMFSFGVQREIAEFNPVKTIKPLGKEEKRDRVLEEDEIKRFWAGFETIREPTRSLFRILLLLGQRMGETRRMKWEYIEDNIWTIPKELTKAKRTHYLPLPPMALEIIEDLKNDSAYVFESFYKEGEPLTSVHASFKRLSEDCSVDDIRIHDLRRTAATYMAELGTDRTILGKVLNHKGLAGDSQVTARYDRHGYLREKRTALNRWASKLKQIVEGTETKITKIG